MFIDRASLRSLFGSFYTCYHMIPHIHFSIGDKSQWYSGTLGVNPCVAFQKSVILSDHMARNLTIKVLVIIHAVIWYYIRYMHGMQVLFSRFLGGGGLQKRLVWALFVLCFQPTELIWAFLFHNFSSFTTTPPPFFFSHKFSIIPQDANTPPHFPSSPSGSPCWPWKWQRLLQPSSTSTSRHSLTPPLPFLFFSLFYKQNTPVIRE